MGILLSLAAEPAAEAELAPLLKLAMLVCDLAVPLYDEATE